MKTKLNFELGLIFLLSFMMIAFVISSFSIVGIKYFHVVVVIFSLMQLLLYFFGFRIFVLRLGGLQFLILGLFLFFIFSMPDAPDAKGEKRFDFPGWVSISFGALLFFCCLLFSSKLLSFSNLRKN